jgi:hypothetical protein
MVDAPTKKINPVPVSEVDDVFVLLPAPSVAGEVDARLRPRSWQHRLRAKCTVMDFHVHDRIMHAVCKMHAHDRIIPCREALRPCATDGVRRHTVELGGG